MADVKWIKISTYMFDNRKIKHLRRLPDGDNIVLIWVMLLTIAGRCNANGRVFLTEDIPYTSKMLAEELNFEEGTIQLALSSIYIIDEIYEHEKETAEIIPIAIQHGIPAKKIMWCDSAEPDRIKEWNKAGYRARGVDKGGSKGSVNAQIDWLKGSVGKDHTIKRKIYVAPHCVNTIKELQQWKWKKDERTGEYLDDPVPVMDDAMAALRYAIEGWRKASRWLM